jgi:HK97 gp10 family phage protein
MTIQMRLGLNSLADLAPRIMETVDGELEDAAEEIADIARDLVPVDTGFLRSTIHVERIDHLALQVRADAEYAAFVEYGTSRMAAQPYMTPAIEAVRAGYEARIARAIHDSIG